jgi:hypothetical protein
MFDTTCKREAWDVRSGAIDSNSLGLSLKILRMFLIGSRCLSFRDLCAAFTRGCSGCVAGRVHSRTAALWHMRRSVSSIRVRIITCLVSVHTGTLSNMERRPTGSPFPFLPKQDTVLGSCATSPRGRSFYGGTFKEHGCRHRYLCIATPPFYPFNLSCFQSRFLPPMHLVILVFPIYYLSMSSKVRWRCMRLVFCAPLSLVSSRTVPRKSSPSVTVCHQREVGVIRSAHIQTRQWNLDTLNWRGVDIDLALLEVVEWCCCHSVLDAGFSKVFTNVDLLKDGVRFVHR